LTLLIFFSIFINMELKVCNKCKIEKSITDYSIDKRNTDGFKSVCKVCLSQYKKEYSKANKEKILEYNAKYKQENQDKIKNYAKKWYTDNKEEIDQYNKEYKAKNKERDRLMNNKTKLAYRKKRIANDPLYKLSSTIRILICMAIKKAGYRKNSRTIEILGCTTEQFKQHLESQFEEWMNWDNHGLYNGQFNYGWDIDHIVPNSSGETIEDIIRLNHYTNLRPLCSKINRDIKKAKNI